MPRAGVRLPKSSPPFAGARDGRQVFHPPDDDDEPHRAAGPRLARTAVQYRAAAESANMIKGHLRCSYLDSEQERGWPFVPVPQNSPGHAARSPINYIPIAFSSHSASDDARCLATTVRGGGATSLGTRTARAKSSTASSVVNQCGSMPCQEPHRRWLVMVRMLASKPTAELLFVRI